MTTLFLVLLSAFLTLGRCRMIHDYIVSGFTKCIPHIRHASRCRMIHDYIVSGFTKCIPHIRHAVKV